jgi:hypothetical protein
MDMNDVLVGLEDFVTHPDNEFITDNERNAFYVLASAISRFNKKYG